MRNSFRQTSNNYHAESWPSGLAGKSGVKLIVILMAFLFSLPIFMSCSGGGGSGSGTGAGTAALATYEKPTEISAVPVDTDASDPSTALNRSLSSSLRVLSRAATDAGTDYNEAETRKYDDYAELGIIVKSSL